MMFFVEKIFSIENGLINPKSFCVLYIILFLFILEILVYILKVWLSTCKGSKKETISFDTHCANLIFIRYQPCWDPWSNPTKLKSIPDFYVGYDTQLQRIPYVSRSVSACLLSSVSVQQYSLQQQRKAIRETSNKEGSRHVPRQYRWKGTWYLDVGEAIGLWCPKS